jgi:hypothetical protein
MAVKVFIADQFATPQYTKRKLAKVQNKRRSNVLKVKGGPMSSIDICRCNIITSSGLSEVSLLSLTTVEDKTKPPGAGIMPAICDMTRSLSL